MPHRRTPLRLIVDPESPLCASGKRGFATEHEALARLAQARQLRSVDADGGRRPGRVERGCYRCAACRWWHLTSAARPRSRRSDHAR